MCVEGCACVCVCGAYFAALSDIILFSWLNSSSLLQSTHGLMQVVSEAPPTFRMRPKKTRFSEPQLGQGPLRIRGDWSSAWSRQAAGQSSQCVPRDDSREMGVVVYNTCVTLDDAR